MWVVMPPMEWPVMPTLTVVSMWPANGSPPVVLRASVRVMTSELSLARLPLDVSPMGTLGRLGAVTMKPAAASGWIILTAPGAVPV